MKFRFILLALLLVSCGRNEKPETTSTQAGDEAQIREMITSFHSGLSRAYNQGGISTDSLIDAYFEKGTNYVAPWGWTEPIDSTKARLKKAVAHVKEYSARIEGVQVKSMGEAAYAFFIIRQNTNIDGFLLEEYLPTTFVLEKRGDGWKIVHAHRSTDYQTFEQWVAMQKKSGPAK
jgi:hypothetical protein